jgi:competence protein ComEC
VLYKEIPFLRIGLPFCAGIVSGLYFKPEKYFLLTVSVIIIAGFLVSLIFNKFQTNKVYGGVFTFTVYILGLLLYSNEKESLSALSPEKTTFHCTLSDYPEEKTNSFMLTVRLNCVIKSSGNEAVRGSMVIYAKKENSLPSLLPGDILIISCTPVEITNRGNPYEFDYKFFMENHRIRYTAFTSEGDLISHFEPAHRKLIHKALIIRERIIGMYKERGITGDRLALVAAITLGQKNMLDPEQKQSFIRAGVMHIMAVSGLHAVIISLFIFNLLFFMKGKCNIFRILITITILWAFAFVTGLTPSVLRATLMFTFIQAGLLMKRRVNGINSVLASAFVLIIIRPSVIFDAGFLLSYSAVIYIISFYQDFYLKLQLKNRLSDKIWQSAVITIVAQAGTLPLTIMLFNRFPAYFILTNLIIVPLSSLLIVTGCIIPLLYPVKFLSLFFAFILKNLTGFTEYLTAGAASMPGSNIENIGMTIPECILLTITIFLFFHYLLRKPTISVFIPATALMLLVITGSLSDISVRRSNELIVYNIPGTTAIGIKTGKILNVYSDSMITYPVIIRHSASLGLNVRIKKLSEKTKCIKAGDKKILICNTLDEYTIQKYSPEIIILTGIRPIIKKNLIPYQKSEAIIFTSEVSSGFRPPGQAFLLKTDTIHNTRKSGAFIKRL